jgi:hypothetical protein
MVRKHSGKSMQGNVLPRKSYSLFSAGSLTTILAQAKRRNGLVVRDQALSHGGDGINLVADGPVEFDRIEI